MGKQTKTYDLLHNVGSSVDNDLMLSSVVSRVIEGVAQKRGNKTKRYSYRVDVIVKGEEQIIKIRPVR